MGFDTSIVRDGYYLHVTFRVLLGTGKGKGRKA